MLYIIAAAMDQAKVHAILYKELHQALEALTSSRMRVKPAFPVRIDYSGEGSATPCGIHFTFGHLGLIIDECRNIRLTRPGEIPGIEKACADRRGAALSIAPGTKAWTGITQNILTGVCGMLLAPPGTPPGQDGILEVALIDYQAA